MNQKMSRRTLLAAAGAGALTLAVKGNTPPATIEFPEYHLNYIRERVVKGRAKTATKAEIEEAFGMMAAMGWMLAYGKDKVSEEGAMNFTDLCMDHYGETLSATEIARHTHNLLGSMFQTMN